MPLLLAILGLAFGAYALGHRAAVKAQVGALPAYGERPPRFYRGDYVFSLPQRRWGQVECLAGRPGGGCHYGVRFPGGRAVVLAEHEIVR